MTLQLMHAQITNLIMRKHNFKLSAVQKSQNSSTVLYNLIKTDFALYFLSLWKCMLTRKQRLAGYAKCSYSDTSLTE